MDPLTIIIDTQEKTPWAFPAWLATAKIGTLKTADYALEGDTGFAVERKSIEDFCGTMAGGWERFQREIERMAGWPARIVIVEGSFSDLVFRPECEPPRHNHHNLTPAFMMRRIAELSMMGVAVLFAETPDYASAVCLAVLKERKKQLSATPETSADPI